MVVRYCADHAREFIDSDVESSVLEKWSVESGMITIGQRQADQTYIIKFREPINDQKV